MTATIGSYAIARARLRIPPRGVASAVLALTDDTAIPIPSSLALTIGDLTMTGTVTNGADFGGQAGYTWEAGAGAWSTLLEQRPPYHNDGGVMLSAVAADLAQDAGELGAVLDGIPDRSLGADWTRPTATARDLLDALTGGAWWLANDGTTHIGPRPAGTYSSSTLTLHYEPAIRMGRAQDSGDLIAGLAPGVTLSAPGLAAPLLIGTAVVVVEHDDIAVELYGEKTSGELFRAMVDAVTQWRDYVLLNPYTVSTVGGDARVAVQPTDARSAPFPDAPALGHMAGIPGATYTLAPGANVAVMHLAADPGSPIVFGHLPGPLPVAVTFDASGSITIGGTAGAVNVGGAGAAALALASPLVTWAGLVNTALAAAGHPAAALGAVATTIAKGV